MPDESKRVAELLDHIQRGDERRFTDFCTALEKNNQAHIVDLLRGSRAGTALDKSSQAHMAELLHGSQAGTDRRDAVPNDPDDMPAAVPNDPDDMPLSRQNSSKLGAMWNDLIDRINSDGKLLGELFRLEVFSDLQIKKLKASY